MVLHNPNNWHWVNKNAFPWAKDWLGENTKDIKAEEDGVTAQLDDTVTASGDVDVSQRKGKVITIFDLEVKIGYTGMLVEALPSKQKLTHQVQPRTERKSAVPSQFQNLPMTLKNPSMLYVSSSPRAPCLA